MKRSVVYSILIVVFVALVVAVFSQPHISQDVSYHNFVDTRGLLGVPNFGDVVSNFLYVIIGIMGVRYAKKMRHNRNVFVVRTEATMWRFLFYTVFFVGLGSAYYHWAPDNPRLVWDRFPMALGFAMLLSLLFVERIGYKFGLGVSLPLLIVAGYSVFYWIGSEYEGQGDLRLYGLIQILPMVYLPLLLTFCRPLYTKGEYLFYAWCFYVVAKLCEHYDNTLYLALQGAISGHTLKHIAGAFGIYMLLRYIKKREHLR